MRVDRLLEGASQFEGRGQAVFAAQADDYRPAVRLRDADAKLDLRQLPIVAGNGRLLDVAGDSALQTAS